MPRPKKTTRHPDLPPRTLAEVMRIEEEARRLYLQHGGKALDGAIDALTWTNDMYRSQCGDAYIESDNVIPVNEEHAAHIDRERPKPFGPDVTIYENRMAAGKIGTLNAQREKMIKHWRDLLTEAADAEALAKLAETSEPGDESSETTRPAKAGDEVEPTPKAQAAPATATAGGPAARPTVQTAQGATQSRDTRSRVPAGC
jgi:hypothetical protein